MRLSRRDTIGGACSVAALAPIGPLDPGRPLTPEQFGAKGDGRTNDTAALAALAAYVNRMGGGQIEFRPRTYVVGRQVAGNGGAYAFEAAPILEFVRCSGPLAIRGNGARLLCAPGLRFGTFEAATGEPARHDMPYYELGGLATPYRAMIRVEECLGPVEIHDFELDGNLPNLVIGGQYGDIGWQIQATGIQLIDNQGPERLERLRLHHHALDGLLIDGASDTRRRRSAVVMLASHHNGRQGCSITGGNGYDFEDCSFVATGKSVLASAPGAGVDIEAEGGKRVRDLKFIRCSFSDNSGPGLLADGGPSERAGFRDCTFIGTTSWAAWPNRPALRFFDCKFVGPIVRAYGDTDPLRACIFVNCTFRDDPALAPNHLVYGGANPSRPIADLPENPNVLFDRCAFRLTHRSVLPWTTSAVTFADCMLSQKAPEKSYPRGTFRGRNIIMGNVDLYGARIGGELIVNGRRVPTNL